MRMHRWVRLVLGLSLMLAGCATPVAKGPPHPSSPGPRTPSVAPSPTPPPPASPTPPGSPTPGAPSPSPSPSPPAPAVRTVSAIAPNNTSRPIPGATNGAMNPALLIHVDANCDAYRPAATSLERLFTVARAEGIPLGANRCYRPLSIQTVDRNAACTSGNCACAAVGGTSDHGWGEAADFSQGNGSVDTFTSPTYKWLTLTADRFGWNHPGWAVPGGGPCPEPWHWEWVGDGGVLHGAPIRADVVALVPAGDGQGYRIVTGLGASTGHGSAGSGSTAPLPALNRVIAGAAALPGGNGWWLVAADGGVFAYGNAPFLGSLPTTPTAGSGATIAGIAATPHGKGYLLVSTDGQVFSFGDAPSLPGATNTGRFFVSIASTPSGKGAWLASSDGQVTALGDAPSFPPAPVDRATDPVVAIAATPSGQGCWLATANGVVSALGDAQSYGSIPGRPAEPVVSLVSTASGHGYWMATADGAIYAFGDAGYYGGG